MTKDIKKYAEKLVQLNNLIDIGGGCFVYKNSKALEYTINININITRKTCTCARYFYKGYF